MKNGDIVILDENFNNSSEVKLIELRKIFSTVSDGNGQWETMTCRLTEKQTLNENTVLRTSNG